MVFRKNVEHRCNDLSNMKPPQIPSDKEIEALAIEIMGEKDDSPKMCANCSNWLKEATYCPTNKLTTLGYMTCAHHKPKMDEVIRIAKNYLMQHAEENKKIELILSAALSCANMTMTLMADAERRVKAQREAESDARDRSLLKKDLDLCESIGKAYGKIAELIRQIEQQFDFYVQPHYNKVFSKNGKYDVENMDKFSSDTGEFIEVLLKYIKVSYKNTENMEAVHNLLDSLENNQYFPLEKNDIKHYRFNK